MRHACALARVEALLGKQARGGQRLGPCVRPGGARPELLRQLLHLQQVPLHLGDALAVLCVRSSEVSGIGLISLALCGAQNGQVELEARLKGRIDEIRHCVDVMETSHGLIRQLRTLAARSSLCCSRVSQSGAPAGGMIGKWTVRCSAGRR